MITTFRQTSNSVMKRSHSILLDALLCFAFASISHAELQVWTLNETRHVLRSDLPGPATSVKLAAARNEWVSFQILLRSEQPVQGINIEAGDLQASGGSLLRGADARLYRQHQLHLETGTYRNDAFKSDWYPDPLIPFQNPLTGRKLQRARLSAVPFDLPANQTHGFWVDLYIPADAKPGEYRGVYRVTGGGSREIPVLLTVWDFSLPPTPALVTAFGSPRLRAYYGKRAKETGEPAPFDWTTVDDQCARLLSENRFNAVPPHETLNPKPQADGSYQIAPAQVQALRGFIDRYHVNAVQTPHPNQVVKDPEKQRDTLRAWLAAFDQAAKALDRPNVLFYIYLKDEPNTLEDYRYVQEWGQAVREAKSVVKALVVEQTWTEPKYRGADSSWGDLYGAVDIWCPMFSLYRQESAAKRQALGETIWTYTALCQGAPSPWWHIDFPLLNYRVPAWMAWRDGITGLLYWGSMSYWDETPDPWTQTPIYSGRGKQQQGQNGLVFNGEGSLVYPARAIGYDGVVPTIRLKALRDSIEDYDYLAILDHLGKAAEARGVVRALTQTFFQWDKDPRAYEQARAKLAEMILRAQGSHEK
jgi:hypothetical protein